MKIKNKTMLGLILTIFVGLLLSTPKANAQLETLYLTNSIHLGSGTNDCIGSDYVGFIQYTNKSAFGGRWLTPPPGATYAVIGNMNSDYDVSLEVAEKGDLRIVCGNTAVELDVYSNRQYDVVGYVITPTPPSGTVFYIQWNWY